MASGPCFGILCGSPTDPEPGGTRQSWYKHHGVAHSAHDGSYCYDRGGFQHYPDQQASNVRGHSSGRTCVATFVVA